ncbi:MAG: metallopeptidase [Gemmataceae bacterium]|nr:metallopeptidase [Gemmataceae bacterium]
MRKHRAILTALTLFFSSMSLEAGDKPVAHTPRVVEGWTIRVDDRLLQPACKDQLGQAIRFLEAKLADIKRVVPPEKVTRLQKMVIVLDQSHGNLKSMQYHPSAAWLKENGYSTALEKCVHLPRVGDVATRRNTNEQPWVILHELAHAYHDQVLGFEEPRVKEAFENYKKSGRGEKTLLFNGQRVRHYALTNHKEFFAEMTEAYFGVNDFFPFTRAELQESEPAIFALLKHIWG